MANLGRRERLLIGGGGGVVLLVVLYLFLVEPLVDRAREAGSRAIAREAVLERRRLTIARGPRIAEELQAMKTQLESESARLLRGPPAGPHRARDRGQHPRYRGNPLSHRARGPPLDDQGPQDSRGVDSTAEGAADHAHGGRLW